MTGAATQPRRDDIQGLRAIAVVSVLLFHAFPKFFPGGFIGVDVFFVISGYLITGIIYREASERRFSFANFYSRRVRRIFPALFAMLIPTTAAGLIILSPEALLALSRSTIAAIFSVSNIYFWRTSGYFAAEADLQPLLHTWSLGVEEQFYIFLPILVLAAVRFARRHVTLIFAAIFLISLVLSEAVLGKSVSASYFLLPTRAFQLLAGSMLAVSRVPAPVSPQARNALCIAGLALMVVPIFAFSDDTPFPGLNALYPTVGAALVLLAGSGGGAVWTSRLISTAGFRFFGDISYSLYLWHWPILAYLRVLFGNNLSVPMAGSAVVAAILLATLSYRMVEQPIMHRRTGGFPFLRTGALAMMAGSLAMVPAIVTSGMPGRFSPQSLSLFNATNDFNPKRAHCHNDNGVPMPYRDNCIFGDRADAPILAVWGDSFGAELAYAMGQEASRLDRNIMEITASMCPPSLNFAPTGRPYCISHNAATLDALVADKQVDTVLLAANGISYRNDPTTFRKGFEEALTTLRSAGKSVLVITQFPWFAADPPAALGYASSRGEDLTTFGKLCPQYDKDTADWNGALYRIAARHDAKVISAADILCTARFCPMYRAETGPLYFNKNHISLTGAREIAKRITPMLSAKKPAPTRGENSRLVDGQRFSRIAASTRSTM